VDSPTATGTCVPFLRRTFTRNNFLRVTSSTAESQELLEELSNFSHNLSLAECADPSPIGSFWRGCRVPMRRESDLVLLLIAALAS
jgi:hypothetical protein